jgi:hypothetical protein
MKTKKGILSFGALVALMAAYVFVFSLVSTSQPIATSSIAHSQEVLAAVGKVKAVSLIGVRQKLVGYGGVSCTSSIYAVVGDKGFEFVGVHMSMRAPDHDWVVDDLSLGWFNKSAASC